MNGFRIQRAVRAARIVLASGLLIFLVGCAHGPTAEQAATADYGSAISQADAQEQATQFMRRMLKDPQSATYEWGQVEKGYIEAAPLVRQALSFGYHLEAQINSKNSYGGYTGAKRYQFHFRNGILIGVLGEAAMGSNGSYMQRLL